MRRTFNLCSLAFLMASAILGATAATYLSQSPQAKQNTGSLENLVFISGRWTGEMDGGVIDEHWSAPSGDNMMCVFRFVKGGKAIFYEILLIEMTASGPVLRLKHFNPGLTGWEEKNEVHSYPLVELDKNKAVFEKPDKTTRMRFQRTSPESLLVVLERMKDGKTTSEEFKYRLAK